MSETDKNVLVADEVEAEPQGGEEEEIQVEVVRKAVKHDLVPVHSVLLDFAIKLQQKVNQEIFNIGLVRQTLAREM